MDHPHAPAESLFEHLQVIAVHRPSSLIADSAWNRLGAVAAGVPGAASGLFGFECPLGGDAERVDFLFCSTRDEGHTRVLVDPAVGDASAAWRAVRSLCAAWNATDPALERMQNLWLEFDVGSAREGAAAPPPSLFFGLLPSLAGDPTSALALARRALTIVGAGTAVPGDALLARLFAALPAGAHVFQIGMMLGRDAQAIRACVRDVDAAGIAALLSALDWHGDHAALRDLCATLAARAARIDLDVDLGASVGPRIGLECYPGSDDGVAARLVALTDWLSARGLCSATQADELRRFHGLTHPRAVAAPWPASWQALAAVRGERFDSCACRWVHHVKVVFEAGAATLAKAYLAVEHVPLDRRDLARAIAARRDEVQP